MKDVRNSDICDFRINEFQYYHEWLYNKIIKKKDNSNTFRCKAEKISFFVVYCSFLDILRNLSNNAIKLYLYMGLRSNSKGYSRFNIISISTKLEMSCEYTQNALDELVALNLVFLSNKGRYERCYISPYDANIYYSKSDSLKRLSKKYRDWINYQKQKSKPFFLIPKSFIQYWGNLKYSGSIKLYVYSGIRMNKDYGYMIDSLDRIAGELKVSKRTIINWFSGLEEIGLVERHQLEIDRCSCTHVIPLW